MNAWARKSPGFTVVELLIVIIVIAILAAITVVAYNGIQTRAKNSKRDADLAQLDKAIRIARLNTGNTTVAITGTGMSTYGCTVAGGNTSATEPRLLPKSNACWTQYYSFLTNIGNASGTNLNALRDGDTTGNPYYINENDGENNGGNYCTGDDLGYFTGSGVSFLVTRNVPSDKGSSC